MGTKSKIKQKKLSLKLVDYLLLLQKSQYKSKIKNTGYICIN